MPIFKDCSAEQARLECAPKKLASGNFQVALDMQVTCKWKRQSRHTHKRVPLVVPHQTIFRVVVKANLTKPLAEHLLGAFARALRFLAAHGAALTIE